MSYSIFHDSFFAFTQIGQLLLSLLKNPEKKKKNSQQFCLQQSIQNFHKLQMQVFMFDTIIIWVNVGSLHKF